MSIGNPQTIINSPIEVLLKENKISQLTYERVISAKKYIERKYNVIKLKRVENNILHEKLNMWTSRKKTFGNYIRNKRKRKKNYTKKTQKDVGK